MRKETRFSYAFILVMLLLAGWLHLTTLLLTICFSYFVLSKLRFGQGKWLPILLFSIVVLAIFYGFAYFIRHAFIALPSIFSTSIPPLIAYATEHGVELPFTDEESLKALLVDSVRDQVRYFWSFAKIGTKEFVALAVGVVVAASLFLNPTLDLDHGRHLVRNNLYSLCCDEIAARFRAFYRSFVVVMGAQLIISIINTGFTALFILAWPLRYSGVIIGVTFLCGMLPILGNLISNSIIVAIYFTDSPKRAIWALIFLVTLHKMEYFLNSKIVGERIKNPVWLTLLGLVIGERLMGFPGMILAPVLLNYLKVETSTMESPDRAETLSLAPEHREPVANRSPAE